MVTEFIPSSIPAVQETAEFSMLTKSTPSSEDAALKAPNFAAALLMSLSSSAAGAERANEPRDLSNVNLGSREPAIQNSDLINAPTDSAQDLHTAGIETPPSKKSIQRFERLPSGNPSGGAIACATVASAPPDISVNPAAGVRVNPLPAPTHSGSSRETPAPVLNSQLIPAEDVQASSRNAETVTRITVPRDLNGASADLYSTPLDIAAGSALSSAPESLATSPEPDATSSRVTSRPTAFAELPTSVSAEQPEIPATAILPTQARATESRILSPSELSPSRVGEGETTRTRADNGPAVLTDRSTTVSPNEPANQGTRAITGKTTAASAAPEMLAASQPRSMDGESVQLQPETKSHPAPATAQGETGSAIPEPNPPAASSVTATNSASSALRVPAPIPMSPRDGKISSRVENRPQAETDRSEPTPSNPSSEQTGNWKAETAQGAANARINAAPSPSSNSSKSDAIPVVVGTGFAIPTEDSESAPNDRRPVESIRQVAMAAEQTSPELPALPANLPAEMKRSDSAANSLPLEKSFTSAIQPADSSSVDQPSSETPDQGSDPAAALAASSAGSDEGLAARFLSQLMGSGLDLIAALHESLSAATNRSEPFLTNRTANPVANSIATKVSTGASASAPVPERQIFAEVTTISSRLETATQTAPRPDAEKTDSSEPRSAARLNPSHVAPVETQPPSSGAGMSHAPSGTTAGSSKESSDGPATHQPADDVAEPALSAVPLPDPSSRGLKSPERGPVPAAAVGLPPAIPPAGNDSPAAGEARPSPRLPTEPPDWIQTASVPERMDSAGAEDPNPGTHLTPSTAAADLRDETGKDSEKNAGARNTNSDKDARAAAAPASPAEPVITQAPKSETTAPASDSQGAVRDASPLPAGTAPAGGGQSLPHGTGPLLKENASTGDGNSAGSDDKPIASSMESSRLTSQITNSDVKIALQGEQMGPVELRAKVSGDQLSASITVEHHETHALLSADMPALHQVLNDRQLRVNEILLLHDSLSSSDSPDGGPPHKRDQALHQQNHGPARTGADSALFPDGPQTGRAALNEIFDSRGRLSVRA